MASTKVEICLYDNETLFRSVTYVAAGVAVDITGSSITMEVRRGRDGDLVSTLSTGNGRITITDPVNGAFEINMSKADVAAELGEGEFCFDLVLTSAGGVAKRLFGGDITVLRGTTQA